MRRIAAPLVALFAVGCAATATAPQSSEGIQKIEHVVVLFQENWSFDGLFGKFPGANGLANATDALPQSDKSGHVYAVLPPSIGANGKPDPRIPTDLPNAPFDLGRYVPPTEKAGNPIHLFYQNQLQIDGGKMDRFVAWTTGRRARDELLRRERFPARAAGAASTRSPTISSWALSGARS